MRFFGAAREGEIYIVGKVTNALWVQRKTIYLDQMVLKKADRSLLRFCYVNYSLSFTLKSMCSLTLIKISV